MNIGIIGDLHMKDFLSYADYISDRRVGEKKAVLDHIVESFKDCEHIVFMGDNFNSKNNSSETNREFVEFLERFGARELYILSGNHEKRGDGGTAIDFLSEVRKNNWHIFTGIAKMEKLGKYTAMFAPYLLNHELGAETTEEATKTMLYKLRKADFLFTHHMISGTVFMGMKAEDAKEIVLPVEELNKRYEMIFAGHIHEPQQYGNVTITGNVFTNVVGDEKKFIWKFNVETKKVTKIELPCRPIMKITDPKEKDLLVIPRNAILKVIITKKSTDVEKLKEQLSNFDASLVVEDYPSTRKKMHIEDGAIDFSIESLLALYAKEKGVELPKLLHGLSLINDK